MANVDTNTLSNEGTHFILEKKQHTMILPKWFLKPISSQCSSFSLTTYQLRLMDVFSSRKLSILCSPSRRLNKGLLTKNESNLSRSCNFTFRYTDDVLSLNNSKFGDFVDRIYPIELVISNTVNREILVMVLFWPRIQLCRN